MRNSDAEAQTEKRDRRVGEFLKALGGGIGVGGLEEGVLSGFSVRMPTEEEPSALLVIKAREGDSKRIAFVGAYNCTDAILAWRARSSKGSVKWREDVPWRER